MVDNDPVFYNLWVNGWFMLFSVHQWTEHVLDGFPFNKVCRNDFHILFADASLNLDDVSELGEQS